MYEPKFMILVKYGCFGSILEVFSAVLRSIWQFPDGNSVLGFGRAKLLPFRVPNRR